VTPCPTQTGLGLMDIVCAIADVLAQNINANVHINPIPNLMICDLLLIGFTNIKPRLSISRDVIVSFLCK